jgi:hypothetical protein
MRYILVILSILLPIDNARSNNPIAPLDSSQSLISTSDSLNGIVFTFAVSKDTLRDYDSLSMVLTALNKTSKADTILMGYLSCGWQLLNDSDRIIMSGPPSGFIPYYVITFIIEPNQLTEIYSNWITFNPPNEPETYSLILYYDELRLEVKIPVGKAVTNVTIPLKLEPDAFQLFQNYPNPFNPTTTISYSLPQKTFITLKVYDVLGRDVVTLINKEMEAGIHSQQLNLLNMPSGIYFYRIEAGNYTQTKKLVLLK